MRLRASEEKYRSLIEASPAAVVMSDLAGKILFASRPTWELFRLSQRDELIGRSVYDYLIEADRPRLAANIVNLLSVAKRRNTDTPALPLPTARPFPPRSAPP